MLTDRDKMSNLYRGPSIDASYQVLVHLAKVSEEKIFRNRTIRNKNCLWRPLLLLDKDKMNNLHRGPSTDSSYEISIYLEKRFQRRSFVYKLTNQKQELSVEAMFVNGSRRNKQPL